MRELTPDKNFTMPNIGENVVPPSLACEGLIQTNSLAFLGLPARRLYKTTDQTTKRMQIGIFRITSFVQ